MLKKIKAENFHGKGLDRLKKRFGRGPVRDQSTREGLFTSLKRNIRSQKMLAEWQDALRSEQEILLENIQTAEAEKNI